MKALEILKAIKEGSFLPYHPQSLLKLEIAIEELETLQTHNNCLKCKYRNTFDPYCSHPHVSSKHVPEYINNIGCNYYEPKDSK